MKSHQVLESRSTQLKCTSLFETIEIIIQETSAILGDLLHFNYVAFNSKLCFWIIKISESLVFIYDCIILMSFNVVMTVIFLLRFFFTVGGKKGIKNSFIARDCINDSKIFLLEFELTLLIKSSGSWTCCISCWLFVNFNASLDENKKIRVLIGIFRLPVQTIHAVNFKFIHRIGDKIKFYFSSRN